MRYFLFLLLCFSPVIRAQQPVQAKAKEGKAIAIIKKAIRNKSTNDPQKILNSFEFRAYNKLIVSADSDSIPGKIDTITKRKFLGKRIQKIDSTQYKLKKMVARQHFFQTEKISEYQFDGKKLKETVLSTKMAGFSKPIYEVLGFKLQSFSIYENNYELFETKYNGPLAPDALKDYQFSLLDSVEVRGRQTYRLFFKNKKRRNASGLQGILYIDSENFAIAKAVMEIKGVLNISGTHEFQYIESDSLWFPIARKFRITKGNNDEDIRILGGTIRFDAVDKQNPKREKEASDVTYLLDESIYSRISYNRPIKIKKRAIAMEVKDEPVYNTTDFWNIYRKDSLDIREENTYRALDSIVAKEKIEKKLRFGRKIINGYVPLGFFDVDLRYLLSYNNYEGFRFGFGGITNDRFSEKYRIDTYAAYGAKDGNFKYNIGGAARIGKFSNTWIGGGYTDDVREIASTAFAIDKRVFKLYDPRPINVSTFYNYKLARVFLETKIIPKTESIWQISQNRVEPKFNYVYNLNGNLYTQFAITSAMVSIQWNPFSDFMQTPSGRVEIEKRFPKFTFQVMQTLPGILNNDFEFGKFDFRGEYEKKYLNGQRSAVLVEAGYAHGDAPITHLYNTSPNSLNKDKLYERITIAGKNSFETMYFNEFFSSKYVMLQLKHGFKRVLLFKKVQPSFVMVTRMAVGGMEKPEQHVGQEYKTLEDGYFESGVELNQIFRGFGFSGFYRYGPNQLARFEDNVSIKVSFVLDIGL